MSSNTGTLHQNNWKYLAVSEFADVVTGGTPRTSIKEFWENGNIPWLPSGNLKFNKIDSANKFITDLGLEKSSAKLMPINTVVIAMTGATLGRVGVLGIEASANQSVTGILPNDTTEPKFLFYFLWSSYHKIISEAGGSAQPGINQKYVKNLPIPIPPLEEQKHIVAKIDTLFAKIDKAIALTEESLRQAKNLLPSVLKEVFETMDGVEKFLPDLVKEGRYSIKRGPFGSSLKKQFFVPSGYKVYEQKHAIKNDFEIGEYFVNEEKYLELKAFELKPRDIIISCSGTIGKIAVAPNNLTPGIINQALLKISLNEDEIEILFFTYWFNNYVNNGSLLTKGAAIKNIVSVKELKTIPIKVPNINKQKEICDKLDRYLQLSNQTQSKLEEQLAYLKQLKSSILSKAFKGEL